jgi:hypothetical protein
LIATPSTPNRNNTEALGQFEYQMTQDNRKKIVNKTPGGGKIILKKINQFSDDIKLGKTYKN